MSTVLIICIASLASVSISVEVRKVNLRKRFIHEESINSDHIMGWKRWIQYVPGIGFIYEALINE